jgi:uncharacterized RDD family membrane protein YckC
MKVKVDDFRTYRLAGIGERVIALIVDNMLLGVIAGIFGVRGGLWAGGTMALIVGVAYHWFFLTRYNGQTPGKMLLGIRVISQNGGKLSDLDAILRYLGYYLNSIILSLGWIWALFDAKHQGWHDKLARTYVVSANDYAEDIVYVEPKRKYGE